jgi:hypothetical protein
MVADKFIKSSQKEIHETSNLEDLDDLAEHLIILNNQLQHTQKINLYITGFGKFANILENPTTFIVKELQKKMES